MQTLYISHLRCCCCCFNNSSDSSSSSSKDTKKGNVFAPSHPSPFPPDRRGLIPIQIAPPPKKNLGCFVPWGKVAIFWNWTGVEKKKPEYHSADHFGRSVVQSFLHIWVGGRLLFYKRRKRNSFLLRFYFMWEPLHAALRENERTTSIKLIFAPISKYSGNNAKSLLTIFYEICEPNICLKGMI